MQHRVYSSIAKHASTKAACDALAGRKADNLLYLPLIARIRQMLGHLGLLYVGDGKIAALLTQADIAAHEDYYLCAFATDR